VEDKEQKANDGDDDDDDERTDVTEDDSDKKSPTPHTIIKRGGNKQIQVKVNINVSQLNTKKSEKKKPKKEVITEKQKQLNAINLLDILFSFIGVSSNQSTDELKMT